MLELIVGNTYRGKRPAHSCGHVNDQQILWISACKTLVQYDSPSVRAGCRYPQVTVGKFLKWAGEDITDTCGRDWEYWESYLLQKRLNKEAKRAK